MKIRPKHRIRICNPNINNLKSCDFLNGPYGSNTGSGSGLYSTECIFDQCEVSEALRLSFWLSLLDIFAIAPRLVYSISVFVYVTLSFCISRCSQVRQVSLSLSLPLCLSLYLISTFHIDFFTFLAFELKKKVFFSLQFANYLVIYFSFIDVSFVQRCFLYYHCPSQPICVCLFVCLYLCLFTGLSFCRSFKDSLSLFLSSLLSETLMLDEEAQTRNYVDSQKRTFNVFHGT